MKKLACLLLLAACELQPAPKQQPTSAAPAVPPEPTPPPVPAPVEAPPAPADAGSTAPAVEITPACLQVGAKVAQVFIDSARDPAQHTIYEQERANMTRRTGAACTTQKWSDAARACYLATKTPADIKTCELKFTPPPAPPPARPGQGSGSAAQPAPSNAKPAPNRPATEGMRREPGTPARR